MKIFTKKGILQKTTIVILMIFCINFITPTYSNADAGGVLASPIVDFFCSIGDVVINLLQRTMTGEWASAGATNMSLSAFLVESGVYYEEGSPYYTPAVGTVADSNKVDPENDFDKGWLNKKEEYYIPAATYSPEQIFAGNVPGLDINFINPNFEDGSAALLQQTISSWYVALRNLAVVGLLCVLVYVGIRIMLSSTAADKSKYKQMFTDWLIALCILFFMHYIMSFILTLTESITTAIGGDGTYSISVEDQSAGKSFSTNLLGLARFKTQYKDFGQKFTYFIFYMALVAYTAIFTWHYLKRLLMMAFLTIIAPMVAFTYPIDKIGDGKAQAFNMWLKEYIYNALIQPFHLIIYMVFVGSAMDLVETNILYAIAVMGFILPAEKILKKMFGFDRAPLGTMGALTGFTLGSLLGKGGKGGKAGNAKGGDNTSSEDKPVRYERKHGTDGIDYNKRFDKPEITDKNKDKLGDSTNENNDGENIVDRSRQEFEADNNNNNSEDGNSNVNYKTDGSTDNSDNSTSSNGGSDSSSKKASTSKGKFITGANNIISAHGGGKRIALKGAKTLGSAAKYTARTAMKLGGMAAGAGMGLASGKGIAGVAAGATAGGRIGETIGNKMVNAPGGLVRGAAKVGSGVLDTGRRTIDTFNGNTDLQDKAREKAFLKDEATEQYIRDKWTKEHNGTAPTSEEIKAEKESMKAYAKEGITDVAAVYRAKKAEKFGISAEQSAKIAALAQDRKIDSSVLGDDKKYAQRKADFTQEFIDKGLSEADAAKNADYVLNVMKAQVGQQHNLGKKPATSAPTNTSNRNSGGSKPRGNGKKGSGRKK